MSEIDLVLVNETDNCTIYTLQFENESETEFERFYNKFKDDAVYNPDLMRIVAFINKIAMDGAFERLFRPEGKMSDHVVALPVLTSKLRLYCLRLSDKILILGQRHEQREQRGSSLTLCRVAMVEDEVNGGVKNSRTYNEDDTLRGYVITLQNFEKLLREGQKKGLVTITEKTIEMKKEAPEASDNDSETSNKQSNENDK